MPSRGYLGLAAASLLAIAAATGAVAAPKTELTIAVEGEPEAGFDPLLGWASYGSPLIQSTLLQRDADLALEGDLATAWTLSDDGLTWTVAIRDDAVFSDGTPLTAADVAFTYQAAKEAGSALDLSILESVEAVDATTVAFRLASPRVTFLSTLATLGIVPAHAYGPDYGRAPIGSGPFQLAFWNEGEQAVFEPNPHYYGTRSPFQKLTFLFTAEDATVAAAQAGQLDLAAVPNVLAGEPPEGMTRIAVQTVDNRGLAFPTLPAGGATSEGHPIGNDATADVALRRAINVVLDREALVDLALNGFGRPAYGPVDGMPWDNPEARLPDANPEEAARILAEGGWTPGDDGILAKDGVRAAFTITYPASDATRQALAVVAADMIRPLGIDVAVAGKSWEEIQTVMHAEAILFGAGSPDPFESFNLYSGSDSADGWWMNTGMYANPVVAANFEKGLAAGSMEELVPAWQAAFWDGATGAGMRGDAPWAWLVNIDHVYYVSDCLDIGPRQIEPHGHGFPVTYNLEDWTWTCE